MLETLTKCYQNICFPKSLLISEILISLMVKQMLLRRNKDKPYDESMAQVRLCSPKTENDWNTKEITNMHRRTHTQTHTHTDILTRPTYALRENRYPGDSLVSSCWTLRAGCASGSSGLPLSHYSCPTTTPLDPLTLLSSCISVPSSCACLSLVQSDCWPQTGVSGSVQTIEGHTLTHVMPSPEAPLSHTPHMRVCVKDLRVHWLQDGCSFPEMSS